MLINRGKFRFVRKLIYDLKKRMGVPIGVYRFSSSVNFDTGAKTVTVTKYAINNALVMTTKQFRDFAYDLSFIAANKNFTYGGQFDTNTRVFIISDRDLPTTVSNDDHIIYSHQRYQIKEIAKTEVGEATAFIASELKGYRPLEIINQALLDTLDLVEDVSQQ
jgi:hypothetical protein